MNKQDTIIVVVLFVVLVGWFLSQKQKNAQTVPQPVEQGEAAAPEAMTDPSVQKADNEKKPLEEAATEQEPASSAVVEQPEQPAVEHQEEEQVVKLANNRIEILLSSWGGCVKSVDLLDYRQQVSEDSPPVSLNFSNAPVLAIEGVNRWSTQADFKVVESSDSNVVFTANNGEVTLRRTVILGDSYVLSVSDEFRSAGLNGGIVPEFSVEAGSMTKVKSKSSVRGMTYISIDSAPVGVDTDVVHWSKTKSEALDGVGASKVKIENRLQPEGRQSGCGMFKPKLTSMLPKSVDLQLKERTKWVAVKNKFFLSVLRPMNGADGLQMHLRRQFSEQETPENPGSWSSSAVIEEVAAKMYFEPAVIPDDGSYKREYTCYIGPKKYNELKTLGESYGEIMEFGFWSPLSRILLVTLNAIYSVFKNYGVAIILLTIIVRMIFWPITHKSTESMKRMQAIQPEIKKIQAKYKDNPNKLNQATMALYKEHKVNPMAGCLPMLIQIPVFFALFTVLRSAVELRFAEFLWIKDLSEQEGLLADVLPIPLNILPLVMTGLTLFQQKMTPSAGDPQQKKMMMFMPVMFLFLFYPMPSALVLYWTTSQLIALIQLVLQKRKTDAQDGALTPVKA